MATPSALKAREPYDFQQWLILSLNIIVLGSIGSCMHDSTRIDDYLVILYSKHAYNKVVLFKDYTCNFPLETKLQMEDMLRDETIDELI